MAETRKLAAILAADIVGYSRLTGADEDRTLARVRALRSDLIDPRIATHHGRVVKRTGDGAIVEFRSVVDAVSCAREIQNGMVERNAGLPDDQKIVFRIGVHVGDVVEEEDGDLMGDGVNVAARLEGVAKPGAICLSEDAYRQVRSRLDLKVNDLGPKALKNIAEPVRVYSLEVGAPAAKTKATVKPQPSRATLSLAAPVAALILAAGGYWFFQHGLRTAEAGHLSIVVLPFANLSSDPAQDYFADGVTENLTTDLSRIRGSFVIARNTAFTYKGKAVDAKEIGKELGVRYVLEGSAQRDASRVRVNAQLIDAETGAHLWAERFEEDIVDLFKLQDQVVARLGNSLQYELVSAEAERGARSQNPDALDLVMRAEALVFRSPGARIVDAAIQAHALYEQALALDPNNASALAGDAMTYWGEFGQGAKGSSADYDAKILGLADRAIASDRQNIEAYEVKAGYLAMTGRQAEGLSVANDGLAIDPNSALLLAIRSVVESYSRQFDKAKADIESAMRLSPHDPGFSWWRNLAADAALGLGHIDAAIDYSRAAIDGGYHSWFSYLNLAAASALKGDMAQAQPALAEARKINPKLSIKFLSERKPILQPAFAALREAGMPEE